MTVPPWLTGTLEALDAIFDRLPHGLLVQGPGGWGEELVAGVLVERLLGLDGSQAPQDVAHPDLRWTEPESGIVRVDQMRAVIEFLHQTPRFAGRKAAVVVAADRMNVYAANALLKSLEEPPENSFAVLVTSAPGRLLPTVRSRCQRLEVHPASQAAVMAWLTEAGVDPERAERLGVEYGGAPFTVREAHERGEEPLVTALVEVGRMPAAAVQAAASRREDSLADLTARWLRIVHRLTRQTLDRPGPILDFAGELLRLRAAALANTGLNRAMHLERLFLLWADLWRTQGLTSEAVSEAMAGTSRDPTGRPVGT